MKSKTSKSSSCAICCCRNTQSSSQFRRTWFVCNNITHIHIHTHTSNSLFEHTHICKFKTYVCILYISTTRGFSSNKRNKRIYNSLQQTTSRSHRRCFSMQKILLYCIILRLTILWYCLTDMSLEICLLLKFFHIICCFVNCGYQLRILGWLWYIKVLCIYFFVDAIKYY